MKVLVGDITKPHLRKKFKTVPMKDKDGNVIQGDQPIQHGGPWEKPEYRIKLGKDYSKTTGR